jgi:hypothetical protein
MHRSFATALAVFLCAITLGSAARADDEGDAASLFAEGVSLLKRGKPEAARAKLERSLALERRPSVVFNLAHMERSANRPVAAVKLFREYASMLGTKPELVAEAKSWVIKLYDIVGHLRVKGADGADLSVDADTYGRLPMADDIEVSAGKHAITIGSVSRTVVCEPGRITELDFETSAPSLAPASPPEKTAEAPAPAPKLQLARTYERSTVGYVMPVGLGVLGLAGVGAGVAFGALSQQSADDARAMAKLAPCTQRASAACGSYEEVRDRQGRSQTLAIVSYVTGGALLTAAFVSYLVWPRSRAREVSVVPTLGGAQVLGTF